MSKGRVVNERTGTLTEITIRASLRLMLLTYYATISMLLFILFFDTPEFMRNDCVNTPGIIYIIIILVQHSYMLNIVIVVIVVIIEPSSWFQKTIIVLSSLALPNLAITFEQE
jgi:hypothetical protein